MTLKSSKKIKTLVLTSLLCGMLFNSFSTIAHDRSGRSAGTTPSFKHDRGDRMSHHIKKMARYLQLTEEQQVQMKTIRENTSAEKEEFKQSMESFHDQKKALMTASEFDDEGFSALFVKYQGNFEQMALIKAKSKHAMYQLLNEEQQAKFNDFKSKMSRD